MPLNELADGDDVDQVLLVRDVERRSRRDGGDYLRLQLADRTGAVACMVWEATGEIAEVAVAGCAVHVRGRYAVHPRFGPQINLHGLRRAEPGSFSSQELYDGPPRPVAQLEAELEELVATVQQPHLRRLLASIVGPESERGRAYRSAPAAKHYHQAYRHGLLEHSLGVAQAVSAISATFGGEIDRDLAVTGALLHDVGKLETYAMQGGAIELTDAGKLHGEIALGYYLVRSTMERIEGFPAELAQALGHIILSHHGSLEHGSPVVPCTREATLVHMVDNLGGRLGSFDRLQKELSPGARWSSFDRAIGAGAYFALAPAGVEQVAQPAAPERQAA